MMTGNMTAYLLSVTHSFSLFSLVINHFYFLESEENHVRKPGPLPSSPSCPSLPLNHLSCPLFPFPLFSLPIPLSFPLLFCV